MQCGFGKWYVLHFLKKKIIPVYLFTIDGLVF